MIRRYNERDFDSLWTIINDGARAYKGSHPRPIAGLSHTCSGMNCAPKSRTA